MLPIGVVSQWLRVCCVGSTAVVAMHVAGCWLCSGAGIGMQASDSTLASSLVHVIVPAPVKQQQPGTATQVRGDASYFMQNTRA